MTQENCYELIKRHKLTDPIISIVMPLYNKEAEVKRAVQSVLNQTISDFELIVINDGSTDSGPMIVRNIVDPRIKIIDQGNAGVSAARNKGIKESTSDLIAFLDADDEWKKTFLETILDLKKKYPTCEVFATNYIYCDVRGNYRLPIIRGVPSHPWDGILTDYFAIAAKSDPPLWTSGVAVTKAAIESVGMFPFHVTSGEDLLTWAKLAFHCNIAYSNKHGAIFYLRATMVGKPNRIPDSHDIVGKSLSYLLKSTAPDKSQSLKKYISLWYHMRALQYLQIGARKEAIVNLKKAIKFSKFRLIYIFYYIISLSPLNISTWLMKFLIFFKNIKRRKYHCYKKYCNGVIFETNFE